MGFLKEKYTKEHFTRLGTDRQPLPYGALGAEEWRSGGIFDEIREAIDLVELNAKAVVEIGYGRGESARYMLQHKNIAKYVGVDFSENAHALALETLAQCDATRYELACGDALEFLWQRNYHKCFDAAFMLDVIEHIPASEIHDILDLVHKALKVDGFLVVDTPFYSVDEDYIAQGYRYIAPSPTDLFL